MSKVVIEDIQKARKLRGEQI